MIAREWRVWWSVEQDATVGELGRQHIGGDDQSLRKVEVDVGDPRVPLRIERAK